MIVRSDRRHVGPANYRPAYSLIEMLVVISVTVVLLSMMYRAIVGVMRRASEPDAAVTRFASVSAGSRLMRQDLRRAESLTISGDGLSIEAAADRVIRWRIADRPLRLERLQPGDETATIFGLTGFTSGRFERFEIPEGSGPMVRLTLEPERSRREIAGRSAGDRPFTVEFAVGTLAAPGNVEKGAKR